MSAPALVSAPAPARTSRIALMETPLNAYLNVRQYNTICKYWKNMEKYKSKIEKFGYSKYRLKERSESYEQEYFNYVIKIGYELNDRTQDECLFNFLNNGILLD